MQKTTPIRITLGPSRLACIAQSVVAVGTVAVLSTLPIHPLILAASFAALAAWVAHRIWSIGLKRGRSTIRELRVQDDHTVVATSVSGERFAGHVQDASYVGAYVTTLVLRVKGSRRAKSVLILPDMLPADDFRRLRVLLRYARNADAEEPEPASQA